MNSLDKLAMRVMLMTMDLFCKLVGSSQSVLVGVDLMMMFFADCAGLWFHHVVIVVVVHVLISSRIIATRLRTRSLILLVHAAASWAAAALIALAATAEVARVSVSSVPIVALTVSVVAHIAAVAGALTTWNNQLYSLLLRIEVRIQELNQLLLIFFWKRFQLLDFSCDSFALTFGPKLLQRVVVMRSFSQQATEGDSAAAENRI